MTCPFFRGFTDSISIAVGYIPVAISFGLAAVYADLSPWLAVLVSLLVYAGASQFILISLVASGTAAFSVVGIVLLMNLRHLFYGPAVLSSLAPSKRSVPVLFLAAGLTDEVFATSISRMAKQPPEERESWYLGLQLGAYLAWVGGTAIGAFFGHDWVRDSEILMQTLGFVLPALFFALLLEIRRVVPTYLLVGAAAATILCLSVLPAYGAIVAGMAAGALLGARRA
ncbi:branched-chain amino acid ABC transporter permease [Candidimonas sp. SYP-B2681]|uniref:AzlC family ABC transporter permease n=1 Tax=Candidimonas sp. SYP-B2681 TaxID=2497686 RepID=UPI000F8990F2|nr:AzlC family ABC transporter permease [Candidimonas sp. SYP-B2681]RTZ47899.1 branched-chain amino acid ABC transporter permease [Candidimonas sp. SYP-B2681]